MVKTYYNKSEVKFLGVYLTIKLNRKRHLETKLPKARLGYNLLKKIPLKIAGVKT